MADTQAPGQGEARASTRLGLADFGFLALLALALAAVALCGRFAYKEGLLLETAKTNAQAVAAWAEKLAERKDLALTLARCATATGESAALQGEADWGSCRQALFGEGGPLAALSNPFNVQNPVAGPQCEKRSPLTRGLVLLEKGTPSAPGMPAAVSWTPLADDDALLRGLMLRVQVCDAGGYAVRIAEVKL